MRRLFVPAVLIIGLLASAAQVEAQRRPKPRAASAEKAAEETARPAAPPAGRPLDEPVPPSEDQPVRKDSHGNPVWPEVRWWDMSPGERTSAVGLGKLGEAETREAGRPRNPRDPIGQPFTNIPNIYTEKSVDFSIPVRLANPSAADLAFFRKLAADAPKDARKRGYLALALHLAHQYGESFAEAEAALALDPKEPFAHMARAFTHYARSELEQAIAAFEALLELDPATYSGVYFYPDLAKIVLASFYLKVNREEDAARAMREIIEKSSTLDPATLKQLERYHITVGRLDDAKKLWEDRLAADPEDLNARINLAAFLINSKSRRDLPRALELLEATGTHAKEYMVIPYFRFLAHYWGGQVEESKKDLRDILAIDIVEAGRRELYEGTDEAGPKVFTIPTSFQCMFTAMGCLGDWSWLTNLGRGNYQETLVYYTSYLQNSGSPFKVDLFPYTDDIQLFEADSGILYYLRHADHPDVSSLKLPTLEGMMRKLMTPGNAAVAAKSAAALAWRAAGKTAEVEAALEGAHAADPAQLGVMVLLKIQYEVNGKYDKIWDLVLEVEKARIDPRKDLTGGLAHLFTSTVVLDPFWLYWQWDGKERLFERNLRTRGFDEAKMKTVKRVFDSNYDDLVYIHEKSDSETAKLLSCLLLTYYNWCHVPELYRYGLEYLALDPEARLGHYLFAKFYGQ